MEIEIIVREKVARLANKHDFAVCGNSDYTIKFDFDSEWDAYEVKTARFKYNGTYTDVVFNGCECHMPIITSAFYVQIGVFAGELHTTTSVILPLRKSILCGTGTPLEPSEDVYSQIMELLNEIKEGEISEKDIQAAVNRYLTQHPVTINPADKENIGGIIVGEGFEISEDGVLSLPKYDGEITVTPQVENTQVLNTANKFLRQDIKVKSIPEYEVSNDSGGNTFIIGKEVI